MVKNSPKNVIFRIFRELWPVSISFFRNWHGACTYPHVSNYSETKIMRDLIFMILRDESPGSSRGSVQTNLMWCLRLLTETSEYTNNAASVWHEYCSDAVCPTLMDWQAR